MEDKKFKPIICLFCGNPIQHNALDLPDCVKVKSLEIEAYNPVNEIADGQKTVYSWPGVYACHDCNYKIATNNALNARNIGKEAP